DAGPVTVPPEVRVVYGSALDAGRRAWLFEEVHGVRLRVSARSFFQAGPAGAEALVASVAAAPGPLGPGDRLAGPDGGVRPLRAAGPPAGWSSGRPTPGPTPGSTWPASGPGSCRATWPGGGPGAWTRWSPTRPGPGSAPPGSGSWRGPRRPGSPWSAATPGPS